MVKSNLNGIQSFHLFLPFRLFRSRRGARGESESGARGHAHEGAKCHSGTGHRRRGSLFDLAKSRLKPEEFSQVSDAVPGMDGFLNAAPKQGGGSALGSLGSSSAGRGGRSRFGCRGLRISGTFSGHGVQVHSRDYAIRAVQGRSSVASLLMGALK